MILIVAGVAAIGFGIVAAVGARDQIESDAVARGLSGEPFGFTAAEPDDYTVFLVNAFGGTDAQERAVARTSCTVSFPVGGTQFSGSSQGFSLTLGSASSIGHFDAPAGAGRAAVHGHGLRRARRDARPAGDRHRDRGDRRRRARDPGRDRAGAVGR